MNLGDAFARRKQIDADIEDWINRMKLAGTDSTLYHTKSIEGDHKFKPTPGSQKNYQRNYTIEECSAKIDQLIAEDQALALRISLTNQLAKATLLDLDGVERELSIPELLVLRNEIGPKREKAARSIPIVAGGVEVIETGSGFIKWRSVKPVHKQKEELSDKGHKVSNEYVDHYEIHEVKDYGRVERKVFDEIDKIHAWLTRIRNAINEANKTSLVDLPKK